MTLDEGQGQYNYHLMHSHVWGSHRAKFDDDCFNRVGGIASEGHTETDQTQEQTDTDTDTNQV